MRKYVDPSRLLVASAHQTKEPTGMLLAALLFNKGGWKSLTHVSKIIGCLGASRQPKVCADIKFSCEICHLCRKLHMHLQFHWFLFRWLSDKVKVLSEDHTGHILLTQMLAFHGKLGTISGSVQHPRIQAQAPPPSLRLFPL